MRTSPPLFVFSVVLIVLFSFSDLLGCSGFWLYGYKKEYVTHYQAAMWLQWILFPILLSFLGYYHSKNPKFWIITLDTYVLLSIGTEDLFFYIFSPFFSLFTGIPNFAWSEVWNLSHLNFPKPTGIIQFLMGAKNNNIILLFLNVAILLLIYYPFRKIVLRKLGS